MAHVEDLPLGAPGKADMDLVRRTALLHTPIPVPAGMICRNCSWPYPCSTRLACDELLRAAGIYEPVR
jgi:hypothetical protein